MIELITASPGGGKTSFAINELLGVIQEGRALFQHGVSEFKLPHEAIKCESKDCIPCQQLPDDALRALDWHLWAPDGAIILLDEVQKIYRPRSSSSKVPDSIAAFETHRHRGLDFICITQHPTLIDSHLKNLVSKHVHLTATWARRVKYEWSACHTNVLSTGTAVKSAYRLPKHVYPLYKSAEIHTTVERERPFQVYVLSAACFLLLFFGYRFYLSHFSGLSASESVASASGSAPGVPVDAVKQQFDFVPVVPNHPESAPAYAQVVKVTDFPKLAGCVKSATKCTCFTQQATEYLVSRQECLDFVKTTRFNPYHVEDSNRVSSVQPDKPVS